jgi:hypothetical protein
MKYRWFLAGSALLCCACAHKSPPELLVPGVGDGWLSFAIQPIEQSGDATRFHVIYTAEGKTARFDVEVIEGTSSTGDGITIISCEGRFLSLPDSDASVLLRNLKHALEAKTMPTGSVRIKQLPFTCATLGTRQSHAPDGGFFTQPPGNWTAMKIFIGRKDDRPDFNPVLGKGDFSIKDSDYGDDVLLEPAKVL